MDTRLFRHVASYLIYILVFLIPLNHKETFSVIQPDLVWPRFIFILISFLGFYVMARNYEKYAKDPIFVMMSIFVFLQGVSVLISGDRISTLELLAFYIVVLFAYLAIKDWMNYKKGDISGLIQFYLGTYGLVLVFLVYQIYLQENFHVATGGVWPVPGYPTRYGATFWDVNHFGAYLSSFIFLIAGYFLTVIRGKEI